VSRARLDQLLTVYPWTIRDRVSTYVDAVQDALPEIFQQVGARYDERVAADATFLIGVRKLWMMIDGQYSILSHSLAVIDDHGARGVRFGRTSYSRRGEAFRQVRQLRNDLQAQLRRLEILDLVQGSIEELIGALVEQRRSHGR
jgi:hypothetical protein